MATVKECGFEPWTAFDINIIQKRKRRHYQIADQTIKLEATHLISPMIMQFIFSRDIDDFTEYMKSRCIMWSAGTQSIEITDESSNDIEAIGIKICNLMCRFLFRYDQKPVVLLEETDDQSRTDEEIRKINARYNVGIFWKEETNYLWIVGKRTDVEKCCFSMYALLEKQGSFLVNLTEESLKSYDAVYVEKDIKTAQIVMNSMSKSVPLVVGRHNFEMACKITDDKKGQTTPDVTGRDGGAGVEATEDCCVCMDKVTRPKKLSCGHVFCTECIDQQLKYKPACPQCGAVHGKITGDQPTGTMTMDTTKSYWGGGFLPGYEGCGIININYHFPSGKQGPDHPNPGKHYQSITRPGYLPDNEKGRLVAKLLRIAFDRKLVFTIGRSRTTGQDGVVTWNDIHHKTRMNGGPQAFGYPDPTYLDRVLDELKAKGVTEESLNDP